MDEKRNDKKMELIKNQAKILSGSFDAIQIFATQYDKETGSTNAFAFGDGNWHARLGIVKEWYESKSLPLFMEDEGDAE